MIRYGKITDLEDILIMLDLCKKDMYERGLNIWNEDYPTKLDIKRDLETGNTVVYEFEGHAVAYLAMYPNKAVAHEDNYQIHGNYVYVQRVMSHPSYRRMGHAYSILKFVETLGYTSIRLLTRDVNTYSVNLYKKLGYRVVDTAKNGSDLMEACEKILK